MQKIIRFIAIFLFINVLQVALAHEFWLMPEKFRVIPGTEINVKFLVGEHFKGENWTKKRERTRQLLHFYGKKQEDLTALAIKSDSNDLKIKFQTEGTHLVVMGSSDSYIEMEAEKFNEYLAEDGISDILNLRKEKNELSKKSRELYQRCAKTLIQVGKKTDETYQKEAGLPLEIVPLKNPYTLKIGENLPVKILFKGKPLANYAVRTWYKTNPVSQTEEAVIETNGEGVAVFSLKKGLWMVSLVKMIPATDTQKADYQSYWASLTFDM